MSLLDANAAYISVKPPTRPANISIIRIICDGKESEVVIPRVKPAVPSAEPVSNRQLVSGRDSIRLNAMPVERNNDIYMNSIAPAVRMISSGMRRLKHSTSFLRLNTLKAARKRTAIVDVFIPPAVEPEQPPISISTVISIAPGSLITEKSAVLKPAVLVVTDWNEECSILTFNGSSEYSAKKKNTAGSSISSPVVTSTIFVCNRYFLK